MKNFILKNRNSESTIFTGAYGSFIECLEDAVKIGIDLSGVDLRYKNLSNANLDSAFMPGSDFSQANLTGANLSEACVRGSIFQNCDLYNVCFSYSDLRYCDFRSAQFGGEDITGCDISYSTFSSLSCLELDFWHTEKMEGCHYISLSGKMSSMTKNPVVVKGLMHTPIIVLDHEIHIGQGSFSKESLPKLLALLENRSSKILVS